MSNGIFRKIVGRALSIFGVSDPEDIRRMQARKIQPTRVKEAKPERPEASAGDDRSQEKRTKED
jgi:hypothetical protein